MASGDMRGLFSFVVVPIGFDRKKEIILLDISYPLSIVSINRSFTICDVSEYQIITNFGHLTCTGHPYAYGFGGYPATIHRSVCLINAGVGLERGPGKPEVVHADDRRQFRTSQGTAGSLTKNVPLTAGLLVHDLSVFKAEGQRLSIQFPFKGSS